MPRTILRQNADERLRRALHVTAWVLNGLVTTDELAREVARYEARGRTGGEATWRAVVEASAALEEKRAAAMGDVARRETVLRQVKVGASNLRTEFRRTVSVRRAAAAPCTLLAWLGLILHRSRHRR